MKTSPPSAKPAATLLAEKLTALAHRQADLIDSFPRHYRLVPPAAKRRVANQFDEFIVQLDPLVAKLESTIQKRRVHDRKAIALLRGSVQQADRNVSAAIEETSKLPELAGLAAEFTQLRQTYADTLVVIDAWLRQLDGNGSPVSLAA